MKSKMALKLFLYFAASLLLFSGIMGGVFITLFRNHTVDVNKAELEKRALTIADTLSGYMNGENPNGAGSGVGSANGGGNGYGAYLRFLDDIAMADVWIVDEDTELVTSTHQDTREAIEYNYQDLPADAEAVVKEVFDGNTTFSEGFSELLNAPTLTVGTPIEMDGEVIGALLLHSPVNGMEEATAQGTRILIYSMGIALILSALLSILLAMIFTNPIKKMKDSALLLAAGDYTARTNVQQKDEIGDLAYVIDMLSDRLDAARHESERLDKLRRDFVANISHELRTPVTVIRGSLEALCDEVVTNQEQVKNYHEQMLSESIFLQRLVSDLLDLSRLQNTDFKMEMQELNLCEVLEDAIRSAQQVAQGKNIAIQLSQDVQSCDVWGDYGRLRQMFIIILDNAIKFSPDAGSIMITLKERAVTIRDQGIGIASEDLPYIFDRFYKVKSQENTHGSGLGLAIAKQIADRHGITVSVSSENRNGTIFTFAF